MREDACVRTCQPDYIWSEKLKDLSIADVGNNLFTSKPTITSVTFFGFIKILVGKTWSVILLKLVTLTCNYMRAFGDGPRNFEPWSSDVDYTSAGTRSPNNHTSRRTFQLSIDLTCIAVPYTRADDAKELPEVRKTKPASSRRRTATTHPQSPTQVGAEILLNLSDFLKEPCSLSSEFIPLILKIYSNNNKDIRYKVKDTELKMASKKHLEVGDLVWAKTKYFPFWPAKIVNPPIVQKKVLSTAKGLQKKNSSTARKAQHYVFFFLNCSEPKFVKKNSVKNRGLTKKRAAKTQRQKNGLEKIEKCPQQMNLAEEASDKKPFPLRKSGECSLVSNTLSNDTNNPVVVTQPLNDQSNVARECPSEPFLDLSKPSTTVTEINIKPTSKKIGFLGLGMMGQRIVKNLLHSGHKVSVWNQIPEKCKQFVDAGAQRFLTPADVVQNCDIAFCCVSSLEASKSLIFGNGGILQGLEKCQFGAKGYVEMTPMDPATSKKLSATIIDKGGKYLEASIYGSRSLAEEGFLWILCAGDRELFHDCLTCLFAISKSACYVYDAVGSGSKMNYAFSLTNRSVHAMMGHAVKSLESHNFSQEDIFEILNPVVGPFFNTC
ncbi:putative oxidoreductase GLYR1 homolog [Trichonephila clavipes]|nr:putative oxidoreductase GLYR1 homolog [Trichonephila clavipes]